MKTDFIKDGWAYTTPIYMGTESDVAKMMKCKHQFADEPATVTGDAALVMQGCKCGAKRARIEVKE